MTDTTPPRWKHLTSWVLSVVLGLLFIASGVSKLARQGPSADNFARWGYPPWFLPFTGAVELLGAVLLLVPRTRLYGGAVLDATMIGAVATHLTHGEAAFAPVPLVLGLLAGWVAWQSRRSSSRS